MCGFQDAMCNIMPVDWLDPYGNGPHMSGMPVSVDITIVETEDGVKATSVKQPPQAGSSRIMTALKQALGVDFGICGPENGLQRSDDLGKQDDEKSQDKSEKSQDSDMMKPSSPPDSERQGSQPWSDGKSPRSSSKEKDAKEKAPEF